MILLMQFAISLLLTLLLELPVVWLFRARKKDLLLFLLVNILTNPMVVLLSVLTGGHKMLQFLWEIIAVWVEGWYYRKYAAHIQRYMLCSVCANCFSYGIGKMINFL